MKLKLFWHCNATYIVLLILSLTITKKTANGRNFNLNKMTSKHDKYRKSYVSKPLYDNIEYYCKDRNHLSKCCAVYLPERFDCHPEPCVTKTKCEERGCCWNETNSNKNVPKCFYAKNYFTYNVTYREKTDFGERIELKRQFPGYYANDIDVLRMDIMYETHSRLHFKIYDPSKKRWEVPLKTPIIRRAANNTDYRVIVNNPFSLEVTSTSKYPDNLLDTRVGGFIFADQFIQLSYSLPSSFVYGLGEHRGHFLLSHNWTRITMWNKDQPPVENTNLYGSHPFYTSVFRKKDGTLQCHGVLLLNSNAMEIMLQPGIQDQRPSITWRTTGGILDFYVFTGPDYTSVIQQYTEVIGRSFMPPYWSLGYHLCRWGFKTANDTYRIVERNSVAGVPLEVQWNDIDYAYERKDFTYDKGNFGDLPDLVHKIHERDMHYVMIFDVGISNNDSSYAAYVDGIALDVFIRHNNGTLLVGKVWPGTTVFPDFTHPNAQAYWTKQVRRFHDVASFDGMWIDMNEVSNFVTGSIHGCPKNSSLENPTYTPIGIHGGSLSFYTICASAKQYWSSHYNVHNMYGLTEANASYHALKEVTQKRPFVITRSTFVGVGQWAGHWTGDNFGDFYNLRMSIPAILNMNMFGVSTVGADICGFHNNTNDELCARWHQLAAFYPFMRNHNDQHNRDQDPAAFPLWVTKTISHAISLRYCLLPYLYTLFFKTHVFGEPVVRPLMEWLQNINVSQEYLAIEKQFLFGPAMLVAPVVEKSNEHIANASGEYYINNYKAFFPAVGLWYQYGCPCSNQLRDIINSTRRSYEWFNLSSILSTNLKYEPKINIYQRPGFIVPSFYKGAKTTTENRLQPFTLTAVLDPDGQASGDLYWDDGESLNTYEEKMYNLISFSIKSNVFISTVNHFGYEAVSMNLTDVRIFGIYYKPTGVLINSKACSSWTYNCQQKELLVKTENFDLKLIRPITIIWK